MCLGFEQLFYLFVTVQTFLITVHFYFFFFQWVKISDFFNLKKEIGKFGGMGEIRCKKEQEREGISVPDLRHTYPKGYIVVLIQKDILFLSYDF